MNCRSLALLSLPLVSLSFGQTSNDKKATAEELKKEAAMVSKQVGELASSGKLPTNDEGIKLLKTLVDKLADINERLKAIDGKPSAAPAAAPTKFTQTGYVVSQYQKTDRTGAGVNPSAFRFADIRLNLDFQADPKINGRVSFDLAQTTAQNTAQLRDAWFKYTISPTLSATFGQQVLPIGFELGQSAYDRIFGDRNRFDQVLFPGERSRGVLATKALDKSTTVSAGIFDALAINDPEQLASAPGAGDKLNGVVSVQRNQGNDTFKLSAMAGERPAYTATVGGVPTTSPEAMRQYVAFDWQHKKLFGKDINLFVEGIAGRDRVGSDVPGAGKIDHPLWGFSTILQYNLNAKQSIATRWQQFDPNKTAAGDHFSEIGLGYVYTVAPNFKINLDHEIFVDQSRAAAGQRRYNLTTVRFSTKF